MIEKIEKIIPRYGIGPVLAVIGFNLFTYYVTKFITSNWKHYDISIPLDDAIPTLSIFVIVYVLAYVQWVVGYVMIARDSKGLCFEYCGAELIAKAICFVVFITFPTVMIRPDIVGTDFCSWLLNFIYQADAPTNLFPSIHCLESYLVARAAFSQKNVGTGYKVTMAMATVLIVASVVLVKQHVILDVISGIIVVEIGLFIAKKLKLSERNVLWTRKK